MKIREMAANGFKRMVGWRDIHNGAVFIEQQILVLVNACRRDTPPKYDKFEEAWNRYGMTEQKFKGMYRNFVLNVWGVLPFALYGLGYTAYAFGAGEAFGVTYGMAITALFLANAFYYSFRAYQFRNRSFDLGISDWAHNPQEWIPTTLHA